MNSSNISCRKIRSVFPGYPCLKCKKMKARNADPDECTRFKDCDEWLNWFNKEWEKTVSRLKKG